MMNSGARDNPLVNIEAEQQVLGSILLNNEIADRLPPGFGHEMFGDPVHRDIAKIALGMIAMNREISPVTLKTFMAGHAGLAELGGLAYLAKLAGAVISTASVPEYAALLRDLWARREAQAALQGATEALGDPSTGGDALKAVEAAVGALGTIATGLDPEPPVIDFQTALERAAQRTAAAYQNDGVPLLSTGLLGLDRETGGFMPADHIVLMGESSMGKTALALHFARAVLAQKRAVFFASLEMPAEQLAQRFTSAELAADREPVPYSKLITGKLTEDEWRRALTAQQRILKKPLQFAEDHAQSLPRLAAVAAQVHRKFQGSETPLGLIVVDYLQLVDMPGAKSATERVSSVALGMKALAKRYGVPVLSLSQMNQENKNRDNRRPLKSDARQSGEIEHSCDIMIGAFREEYYAERELQAASSDGDRLDAQAKLDGVRNKLELILLKNRRGALVTVSAWCDVKNNLVGDEAPRLGPERDTQSAMDWA